MHSGLPNLAIQILNTSFHFIDLWNTSQTSVHYDLEHGLSIVTESFSPLKLYPTTSFVVMEVTWQAILFLILFAMCTKLGQTCLNWPQPTEAGADVMLRHKSNALWHWIVPLSGGKPSNFRSYEIASKIQTHAVFILDLLHYIHYINMHEAWRSQPSRS